METTNYQVSSEHILLTSLGKNAFSTNYQWGKETATTDLAPLALIAFLKKLSLPIPNHVVAAVTEEAETGTWPIFQKEICNIPGFNPVVVFQSQFFSK